REFFAVSRCLSQPRPPRLGAISVGAGFSWRWRPRPPPKEAELRSAAPAEAGRLLRMAGIRIAIRSPIKEKTMVYWVKVYGLIAAVVFAPAGMIILSLFVWYQAKAYGSARQRIYKRLSSLVTHHRFSRRRSRFHEAFRELTGQSNRIEPRVQ